MKIFLLLISICISIITNATTYFISPSGNDATGNGTAANPWRTLLKATATVTNPGDIIHVNAGTYIETATCYLRVGVSIEGDGVTSIIKSTVTAQWQEMINLVSPEGTNGNQHISNIKVDGTMTAQRGIWVGGRSNVSVNNCTIVDVFESGLIFSGRNNGNPLPPTIYATGNTVYNNTINNCASYNGNGSGCLMFGGQIGMLIHDNTITQTQRPSGQNGWPIKYTNEGWTRGCKIYNNILTKRPYQNDGWSFCLEIFETQGMEIYGNTIQGSLDFNYQGNRGTYPYVVWIHDNIISQPVKNTYNEEGIIFEYSVDGAIIENNTFNNINQGIVFYPRTGTILKDMVIRKNLFSNMGTNSEGYMFGGFNGALGSWQINNCEIYNNTFHATGLPYVALNISGIGAADLVNGLKVKNNILQGSSLAAMLTNDRSKFINCQFQYNDFYLNGDDVNLIPTWASTGLNFPASTIVSNNLATVNPLYVGGGNFTLQAASPLINAGVNVGLAFNGSAPDIGYAEYTGVTNAPPTANAGADQIISLPTSTTNVTGTGTDTDGTVTAYLWTKISGPVGPVITTPTSASTAITGFVAAGTYQFELRVTDNNGAFGRDTMQVTVNPDPNIAPTADAGPDQSISFPTTLVSVAGSGSDPDGTISSFLWTKISGPAGGVISNPSSALTDITGFVLSGIYRYELRVTDNNGAIGRDTIQITLTNRAPTANAGADQTITLPVNTTNLSGSGNDPDGTVASFLWTKVSGPAGGAIANPALASTSVSGLLQGIYRYELRVTDNSGAIGRDTMQITVNPDPNIAPTANAGADQTITLPVNTANLSGSGNDPDGTVASFLWTKVSGPAGGTIANPALASTSVSGLLQGIYRYELRVTDNSGAIGRDTMQITVNPDPNIAPTANAGTDQTITLPVNTANLSGSGNDPDGTIASYLWTKISGPAGGPIANPALASTSVSGLLQGIYRYELRVTDNSGAVGRDTMQITVNPAPNIAPTANAGPDQTITLPVNTANLSGSGNDPDGTIASYLWTKVSGPAGGAIANPALPSTSVSGLIQGIYRYELRVTDNSGAIGRDTMQITVNPAANIAPTANAGADQTITLPVNTANLSGSGNDPDGTIASYLWTKVSGPAGGAIANAASASTSVSGLMQGIYRYELRVTDNSGAFGRDTMQITVNPAPNVAPTANAGADINITLPTNTVNFNGTGIDSDGTIATYTWIKIAGPIGGGGNITNPNAASTSVTAFIQGVYKFELTVTDNSGATGRDTIQVAVFAPNVAPTANAGLNQSITLPTNTVTLNGSGNDVDGTITAYRWMRIAGPANGTITSTTAAVTSVTGLTAGVYLFELQVTDNSGATGRDTAQITVNAANIPPVANAGPDQSVTLPTNSVTLSGSGTDADGTVVAYSWKQLSGPIDKLTSTNTAISVLDNLLEGVYTFELTVTDNRGATDKDSVTVTVAAALAFASQNNMKIFPNPVVNITTLQVNAANNVFMVLVTINDQQGKMIYQKQLPATNGNIREKIDMSRRRSEPPQMRMGLRKLLPI
ncbi:PKD domain-containing protein [Ferruginibacter sp.]